VYSVDESFLDLSQLHITDYEAWGRALKDRIWREVGIPISMGIAPTKTLAKLASDKPKKDPALQGVLSLLDPMDRIHHLGKTEIQDIWGVGWRLSPRLRASGVATALDLANMRPTHAQQLMGIHGRQMVYELNGTTCYPLEREEKPRQSIARTRTFGHDTSAFHDLEAALASFATQAAYRLRRSNQLTRQMGIFIMTNKHKPGLRSWDRQTRFSMPTADTGTLINAAIDLLKEVYDPRQTYHRAGVWLYDFLPASHLQTDFFEEINAQVHEQSMRRMQAVDDINARFGKRHLRYATEDLGTTWQSKQSIRSPRYTSSWEDLPKARIFY
jgi:DNA polymerase V